MLAGKSALPHCCFPLNKSSRHSRTASDQRLILMPALWKAVNLDLFSSLQVKQNKRRGLWPSVSVVLTVLCLSTSPSAAQNVGVPSELSGRYQAEMSSELSDDFNRLDTNKWEKRASKPRSDGAAGNIKARHNQFKSEGDTRYLSLLANKSGEAGLSARYPHRYGFTVCRWRIQGIELGVQHAAHPAIWSFSFNMGVSKINSPNPSGKTLEIDWMEYIKWLKVPGYHARIIPADNGISDTKRSVYMTQNQTDFDGWRIHGYEYTPEYVRLWEYVGDAWQTKGVKLYFTEATDVEGKKLDREYRSDQYFVLSNIWFYKPEYDLSPVRLDIDYLHHYPMR